MHIFALIHVTFYYEYLFQANHLYLGHGDKFEKGKAAWIEVFKQSPHSQQFIDDFFWTPRVR